MSLTIDFHAKLDGERIGSVCIAGEEFPEAVIWGGQVYLRFEPNRVAFAAMQSEPSSDTRYFLAEVISVDHESLAPRLYEPSEVDAIVERACNATDRALGAAIARSNEWQGMYEKLCEGIGYANHAEGQAGVEVAPPETIIEAFKRLEREAAEVSPEWAWGTTEDRWQEIARQAFDAYNETGHTPWVTFDGRPVPRWPDLNDAVRAKWVEAARSLVSDMERRMRSAVIALEEARRANVVDGPIFNSGRMEGRSDVAASLRRVLDPADVNHWSIDGLLNEVRRLKGGA
ncbi:MAG: hypothetical protein WAZ94_15140 [Phycisphaerales bacterium]|nr:hypothetical protein [Chloroflexota bacterium]